MHEGRLGSHGQQEPCREEGEGEADVCMKLGGGQRAQKVMQGKAARESMKPAGRSGQ